MASHLRKDDPIVIVGAGIFGLSTALHLARRGYTDVTVFDRTPYDQTNYSYLSGADAASADINKIVRSAYGGVSIYQDLSLEAIEEFKVWNAEIASGEDLPKGFTPKDRVFVNHGNLIMTGNSELSPFDQATVDSMNASGHRDSQLVLTDPRSRDIARSKGLEFALDPFQREAKGMLNVGVLDTTGGTAIADKACRFALHKARSHGVKFVFGPKAGAFSSYVHGHPQQTKVTGITTADGQTHPAAITVMACGGWTNALLPQLDHLCESTAGTVVLFRIPRTSDLWHRLSAARFPSWQHDMRGGADAGLYGFARDNQGWLKIGYRGTKYTNPVRQADGVERSVPVTRYSAPVAGGELLTSVPAKGFEVIRRFVNVHLPELAAQGIDVAETRVCWYNDSYDNHLLVDRVAGKEGLAVATAGSGHAFKYLPVIGRYVADMLEGRGLERPTLKAWRWRTRGEGEVPFNLLMEGGASVRALGNIELLADPTIGAARKEEAQSRARL